MSQLSVHTNPLTPGQIQALNEQSAMLNIIVYSEFEGYSADRTPTISEILAQARHTKIEVVKRYLENHPEFGDIRLVSCSVNVPKDATGVPYAPDAFYAMTFYDPIHDRHTIAFGGTPDHAWVENGNAFGPPRNNTYYAYDITGIVSETVVNEHFSRSQACALNYLNHVAAGEGLTTESLLIVTGHSQGGSNAKTVTMKSDLVDLCFGFDGPGFSPEAIAEMKRDHPDKYAERVAKIYQTRADNNVVDGFGIDIALPEHVTYVKGYLSRGIVGLDHDLSLINDDYLLKEDSVFNEAVEGRGYISTIAADFSVIMLKLPPETRVIVARGVMQLLQEFALRKGKESGFNDPAKLWEECMAILVSARILPAVALDAIGETYDEATRTMVLFLGATCVIGFAAMFPAVTIGLVGTAAAGTLLASCALTSAGLASFLKDRLTMCGQGYGMPELVNDLSGLLAHLGPGLAVQRGKALRVPGLTVQREKALKTPGF